MKAYNHAVEEHISRTSELIFEGEATITVSSSDEAPDHITMENMWQPATSRQVRLDTCDFLRATLLVRRHSDAALACLCSKLQVEDCEEDRLYFEDGRRFRLPRASPDTVFFHMCAFEQPIDMEEGGVAAEDDGFSLCRASITPM